MRKYKFFLSSLLIFCFLFCLIWPAAASDQVNEYESVPSPPELTIDAGAAYLMDMDTGDVLYAQSADTQLYPASTTKIMTAYLTVKYGNPDDLFTIPDGIYTGMDSSASTANLKTGEELTVYQLLQCLLIVSANEAANALAIYISGSVDDFVILMNQEAAALGCTGTNFVNTNGLQDTAHVSTAHDLALIAQAAMQYDTIVGICSMPTATIPATNLSDARTLESTNYLLSGTDYPAYNYSGAIGVKTGHTTPAGYCLISAVQRDGHTLISVVLGAKSYKDGTETQIGSFTETIRLLDWGFENYQTAISYMQALKLQAASSPTPTIAPSPSPSPTPSPSVSPSPSPLPSPSPSLSPSPTPVQSPEAVPSSPPASLFSEGTLLAVGIGAGMLILILLIVLFVLLRRNRRG